MNAEQEEQPQHDPRLVAVAEAIRVQHFVIAHGSLKSALRFLESRPFDPDGLQDADYMREAYVAITKWEEVRDGI